MVKKSSAGLSNWPMPVLALNARLPSVAAAAALVVRARTVNARSMANAAAALEVAAVDAVAGMAEDVAADLVEDEKEDGAVATVVDVTVGMEAGETVGMEAGETPASNNVTAVSRATACSEAVAAVAGVVAIVAEEVMSTRRSLSAPALSSPDSGWLWYAFAILAHLICEF
jgi:hypothetical protein